MPRKTSGSVGQNDQNQPSKQKRRNGHAFHPIMLKGGVHEKSKTAKRRAVKHETRRLADEWLDRSSFLTATFLSRL